MPDVTLSFSESEQHALVRVVLDAAAKHLGIDGTELVKHFKDRVILAQQEAARNAKEQP